MSKLNRMLLILMIEKAKAELVNGHNVLTVHARKISLLILLDTNY